MPGIFGFFGQLGNREPEAFLGDMARILKEESWHQVETCLRDNSGPGPVGLGRASLGIVNNGPQPVWNEDQTIGLVMEGEVFDTGALKKDLAARGHRFQGETDAEFILHLYEECGENFAVKLNGAFVVAIWDRPAQKLVIANDRFALHPLFYACRGGCLTFASRAGALLADPELPRTLDRVALAQFLTFDHVLGDRTYLTEVHFLPPASLLTFSAGSLALRSYWKLRYSENYEPLDEEAFLEPLTFYLRQAVARRNADDLPVGILLSGGLDSRVLLGLLRADRPEKPLHAFTWGIPGCDDARYAREVSQKTQAQHHFFELKPDYLLEMAEKSVRLTDGLGNCINLHALATLEPESQYAKVIYKGFMGDALMGYGLTPKYWAQYDPQHINHAHFQVHVDQKLVMFNLPEQKDLFTPDFQRQVEGAVFQTYQAAIGEAGASQMADQRNHFDLRQRVPRMTVQGVEVVRDRAIVRLPFCDNDLVDFTLTVPPWMRNERHIMKRAFVKVFPELAQIPYTETGLPMVECGRELALRARKFFYWHLHRAGLRKSPHPRRQSYANYNGWFRAELRSWVEEIVLSKRFLERGYFNPDYIRGLVDEHMAGARHAVKLGALITLELWHRQFLD